MDLLRRRGEGRGGVDVVGIECEGEREWGYVLMNNMYSRIIMN